MALALPTTHFAKVLPPTLSVNSPKADHHYVLSIGPRSPSDRQSPFSYNARSSPLSQEESDDDPPLSPITFTRNEEYERSRLSYMPPAPRPSSSPSTPSGTAELRPVTPTLFSQQNRSSPSITLQPPPVFPTVGTQSLALRLKRPLPPLPKVDTFVDGGAARSSQALTPTSSGARSSPSSSDERDDDSVTMVSPGSSQSPASSTYTTASCDSANSSHPVEHPSPDTKPRVLALTIPARSHSSPLPQTQLSPIGQSILSPYIAVTPATPAPSQTFPAYRPTKKRTASATSIVIPSPIDPPTPAAPKADRDALAFMRAPSPAPSLTPSVSSTKSLARTGRFTLKRIASRTRLFGRRTLSSASEPSWDNDSDSEDTVVVHAPSSSSGSLSMDDKMLRPGARARSASPSGGGGGGVGCGCGTIARSSAAAGGERHPRAPRVEIAEVTLTPRGDVWEARELHDVIPILRQLRAPAKIRM